MEEGREEGGEVEGRRKKGREVHWLPPSCEANSKSFVVLGAGHGDLSPQEVVISLSLSGRAT